MNAHSIEEDIASMNLATLLAYRESYERATAQAHHPPLMQALYRNTLTLIHQQIGRRTAPPGLALVAAAPPLAQPPVEPAAGAGLIAPRRSPALAGRAVPHQLTLF